MGKAGIPELRQSFQRRCALKLIEGGMDTSTDYQRLAARIRGKLRR